MGESLGLKDEERARGTEGSGSALGRAQKTGGNERGSERHRKRKKQLKSRHHTSLSGSFLMCDSVLRPRTRTAGTESPVATFSAHSAHLCSDTQG